MVCLGKSSCTTCWICREWGSKKKQQRKTSDQEKRGSGKRQPTIVVSRPRAAASVHTTTACGVFKNSFQFASLVYCAVISLIHETPNHNNTQHATATTRETRRKKGMHTSGRMPPWKQTVEKPCSRRKCSVARHDAIVLQNTRVRSRLFALSTFSNSPTSIHQPSCDTASSGKKRVPNLSFPGTRTNTCSTLLGL